MEEALELRSSRSGSSSEESQRQRDFYFVDSNNVAYWIDYVLHVCSTWLYYFSPPLTTSTG